MDELVRHCVRELSFDGELGCNVSRLKDFIEDFYKHRHEAGTQLVDDAFVAFAWSIIVQEPSVRVGLVPPGSFSEVWIAPQVKDKNAGKIEAPSTLNVLPDVKGLSLETLKSIYGEDLRIAMDPVTTLVAISGSHIRSNKLTPMVYSALQLIARGRENGLSLVDLGKKTGYDQKTCFYLVQKLLELDLIVKIRQGGVASNQCILKYFFDRNPVFKRIREEVDQSVANDVADNPTTVHEAEEVTLTDGSMQPPAPLRFEPMDARHLSSLPLVRTRIMKLLSASRNRMHASDNLMVTLGFLNPTRTDRRFWKHRIRELVEEGVIERVLVPHAKSPSRHIRCFRLVAPDADDGPAPHTSADPTNESKVALDIQITLEPDEEAGVKTNVTMYKQMLNLIEESGTRGVIVAELNASLNNFDRRSIEMLLAQGERNPPPAHLSDLGITQVMETYGRERRHRYYTTASYRAVVAQENLAEASSSSRRVESSLVGGFSPIDSSNFYKDVASLIAFQDQGPHGTAPRGSGKPTHKNPILPDGTIKKGRPRNPDSQRSKKRARLEEGTSTGRGKRKRGTDELAPAPKQCRPRKKRRVEENDDAGGNDPSNGTEPYVATATVPLITPRRGKLRKDTVVEAERSPSNGQSSAPATQGENASGGPPLKPGRARSSKKPLAEDNSSVETTGLELGDHTPAAEGRPQDSLRSLPLDDLSLTAQPSVTGAELSADKIGELNEQVVTAVEAGGSLPEGSAMEDVRHIVEEGQQSSQPGDNVALMVVDSVSKPRRGRPPKAPAKDRHTLGQTINLRTSAAAGSEDAGATAKRRRGRPPKNSTGMGNTDVVTTSDHQRSDRAPLASDEIGGSMPCSVVDTAVMQVECDMPTQDTVGGASTSLAGVDGAAKPPLAISQGSLRRSGRKLKPVIREDNAMALSTPSKRSRVLHTNNSSQRPSQPTKRLPDRGASSEPPNTLQSEAALATPPNTTQKDIAESHTIQEGNELPLTSHLSPEVFDHSGKSGDSRVIDANDTERPEGILAPRRPPLKTAGAEPTPKAKVNVSHMRRENELFRLIEEHGGIVSSSTKEFYEAHMRLLELMAQAGEPTSAPVGTRVDRRTVDSTLRRLEDRGRIKLLRTSIVSVTGVPRPVCVAYIPGVSQDAINRTLHELGQYSQVHAQQALLSSPFKKMDEPVDFGSTRRQRLSSLSQRLSLNQGGDVEDPATADRLFSLDDATVRETLLTETTTVAQKYGYINGKACRVCAFHLTSNAAFEQNHGGPGIVSIDKRILHLSNWYNDLSLGSHCALVSVVQHNEELESFFQSDEGRATPMRNLPSTLHTLLQVGRSRVRERFLALLEILTAMGIVTPLEPSTCDQPWVTCSPVGDHPAAYDTISSEDWSSRVPTTAPQYWCFRTVAPLYRYSSSEVPPPYLKDLPVDSSSNIVTYWQHVQRESTSQPDGLLPEPLPSTSHAQDMPNTFGLATRLLRQRVSWKADYHFTWYQSRYLRSFVDQTGATPLDDEDGGDAKLQRICWVVSAPLPAVSSFYMKAQERARRVKRRTHRKERRKALQRAERKLIENKATLARKAAEAKDRRNREWDELVKDVHPEPLKGSLVTRVRPIHNRFMLSTVGRGTGKWEAELKEAFAEAERATATLLKRATGARVGLPKPCAPPAVVFNPPEKSIADLIKEQGPPIPQVTKKRSGRGIPWQPAEDHAEDGVYRTKKPGRRHRFAWNRDYDELARDAYAILMARNRNYWRTDLAAYDQVFPGVPRNSVRQRMVHMREVPSMDAYLKRLEDRWYDLWVQHRGTELLPDADPLSPTNFNLVQHIEFLRKHIDKNAIRVGFVQPSETQGPTLPTSVSSLLRDWHITKVKDASPADWEFMWNHAAEEGREKSQLQQPLTLHGYDRALPEEPVSDMVSTAEAAMKMVFGTPNELYDGKHAAQLLGHFEQPLVDEANMNLLTRGVLAQLVRDPQKSKPGRTLKISDANQNLLGGPVPNDTFADASALEEILTTEVDDWREWPATSTDGDTAALIQLVSDDKVNFVIDTSRPATHRPSIDWNSKKADDDQLEVALQVRLQGLDPTDDMADLSPTPQTQTPDLRPSDDSEHGKSVLGDGACCRRQSSGAVDCQKCLGDQFTEFTGTLSADEADLAGGIIACVSSREAQGMGFNQLLLEIDTDRDAVLGLVEKLARLPVPLLFWVGYTAAVMVSSEYIRQWTVITNESPLTRCLPRRWLDIRGRQIFELWEAALKAVTGVIMLRPGVSQAEIRRRLKITYDRQEVTEILRHLEAEGLIRRRSDVMGIEKSPVESLSEVEEKRTFWMVAEEGHWYLIPLS